MGKGRGDKLASGGVKASFPASEVGITQKKFDDAVGDFDTQSYLKREEAREQEARELRKLRIQAEEAEAEKLDREREARRAEIEEDWEPMTSTTEIGGGYVAAEITRESIGLK